MPILRRESEMFPEDLFDLPTEAAPWLVAHVRSRQEKFVARFLRRHEKAYYLPQVEQKIRRSGRTFTSYLPLFPGYVFVRATKGIDVIWRSDAVAKLIDVQDQSRLAMELGQIRSLQQAGALLVPVPDVAPGDAVRITEGSFRGYVGIVEKVKGSLRLIIRISILNKSVAVDFPREAVTRAFLSGGR